MPRGLARKSLDLIAAAHETLSASQPNTVRGVCYKLFVRKLIPDMSVKSTKEISRLLTIARERGMVPWEWIVDETRPIELAASWANPDDYMDSVWASYRKDRWNDQPERVIVVSEKGTVGGILRPVLTQWGVPFAIFHGFTSATAMKQLAERSVADRRPLTILYVGDHDPSGRHMSDVDLPNRLADYGGEARIERLAVVPEQIAALGLPTFPASDKKTDSRYAWFAKTHGRTCCELDALDPNLVRQLVEDAILRHLDEARWARSGSTEQVELGSLRDFFDSWPGAA